MIIPEAILSDADGTLVNTLHLIRHGQYETAKTYLTQQQFSSSDIPTYDEYLVCLDQSVGGSTRDTFERTLTMLYHDKPHTLARIDFDAVNALLNPVQDLIAPEYVTAYDGLSNFLMQVGRLGVKFAIFTSGSPHHIVRNFGLSLPELGMTKVFQEQGSTDRDKLAQFEAAVQDHFGIPHFTVVTCEDIPTHKPDPASLRLAMERLSVTPQKSLVLGDHTVDMQAGINADITERIGITHGFSDEQILVDAGATNVVSSLNILTERLRHAA